MLPFDEDLMRLLVDERIRDIRRDWDRTNGPDWDPVDSRQTRERNGVLLGIRRTAGRSLIGLGTRVMPSRSEPC